MADRMTHEARLREMASDGLTFRTSPKNTWLIQLDDTDKEVIDAGATALALTRQIAEMDPIQTDLTSWCAFCITAACPSFDQREDVRHVNDCLWLACCRLHEKKG